MFFNQKNKRNSDIKTNFENFDFQVLPTPKFAFILIKRIIIKHQTCFYVQNVPINVDFDSKFSKCMVEKLRFFLLLRPLS